MRRLSVLLCALALLCAACSAEGPSPAADGNTVTTTRSASPTAAASPTTAPSTSTTTTAAASPTSTEQPDVQLPAGTPNAVDDPADLAAISAGDLTPLVPAGSSVGRSAVLSAPADPIDQVAASWVSGEPPARRSGLIVWQRADGQPAWRAVYAFTDPRNRGVFGIAVEQGDLTGDGVPDLLTLEDVGGSGACGTYRVIASTAGRATEILRRDVCDTEIQIARGDLRVREAVFEPTDPHCCPSAFRTTILRWNGSDWKEISSAVSPAPNAS
jgi:hypothetical protein